MNRNDIITQENNSISKVTHYGKWIIDKENNISIDCYVTNDGRRVLSLRGTARAIGLTGGGSNALVRNLKSDWIQPYLSLNLKNWLGDVENNNIETMEGKRKNQFFIPFNSDLFVDLCKAYVLAKNDGVFNKPKWSKQSETADKMLGIMSAFAKVGIIALIDEITGYQEEREKDELQKLLAQYVRAEFLPWAKRFPDEFYIEMFRLKGWTYKGNPKPAIVGKLTNWLVYERLPEGILEELQKKNPIAKNNRRRFKHHQYLTESTGVLHLDKHLVSVITLMRACDNWEQFERMFNKVFNIPYQINIEEVSNN